MDIFDHFLLVETIELISRRLHSEDNSKSMPRKSTYFSLMFVTTQSILYPKKTVQLN